MSDFLNLKPSLIHREIRDTMFGDLPLSRLVQVRHTATLTEPWASFQRARKLIEAGDQDAGKQELHQILKIPKLESRVYLQAWHSLRELGEEPPRAIEKEVLGVVVEVGMRRGLDLISAYSDHRARYFNYSGAGILWDRPDDSLDEVIDDLLKQGAGVVQIIAPWRHPRPPEPTKGNARINLLTPNGMHLGQGPVDALNSDPMGGAILASAFRLMQRLIDLKELKKDDAG